MLVWSQADELDLQLSAYELERYNDVSLGSDTRVLDLMQPCPVVLHSYSNALRDCPCGCRSAFSEHRLQSGGLRGFYVRSMLTQEYRYLHPSELSFMVTVPLTEKFHPDPHAANCLLGQLAAPIQALWVYAHHCKSVHIAFEDSEHAWIDPVEVVSDFRDRLQHQQHDYWLTPGNLGQNQIWCNAQGTTQCLSIPRPTKVYELLRAEAAAAGWGTKLRLLDGQRSVPKDAWLKPQGVYGPYELVVEIKAQSRDQPTGIISIAYEDGHITREALVEAGTCIFEVFAEWGMQPGLDFYSSAGDELKLDDRLWQSLKLRPKPHGLQGSGSGKRIGLCLDFVWDAASFLVGFARRCYPILWTSVDLVALYINEEEDIAKILQGNLETPPQEQTHFHFVLTLVEGHWLLAVIYYRPTPFGRGQQKTLFIYDGLAGATQTELHQRVIKFLVQADDHEFDAITVSHPIEQQQPDSCGTVMLGNVAHVLGLTTRETLQNMETLHDGLAFLSQARITAASHVGYGPPGEDQLQLKLEQLLENKGVPRERSAERASMALKKLGYSTMVEVFQNKNVWASLKAAASKPGVNFMLVKSDELQAKIRVRANEKFKVQPSGRKNKQSRSFGDSPLQLDPLQLQLVPMTFSAGGKPISQIAFADLGANQTGLAFCHLMDVMPYLQEGKAIAPSALGVLTMAPVPQEYRSSLPMQDMRYPAVFKVSKEPLLIHGSLIQLGKVTITRADLSGSPQMDSVPTQTLKLVIHKDQWQRDWSVFIQRPFREVLEQFPLFRLCRADKCGESCQFYHSPVDENVDNLVLDLWNRNWFGGDGKYCKPQEAAHWGALLRVPRSAGRMLQELSGSFGLYIEPRTDSGQQTDSSYVMVWLGSVPLATALHKVKTTPNAIAVGRLHLKYGVRFAEKDAPEGFKLLRPDDQYIAAKPTSIYKIFPVPFGTQRNGLQRALTQWGWSAKVLQPAGASVEGHAWEVGAAAPPPSNVLQGAKGDMVVTFLRHHGKEPSPVQIVATASTRGLLQGRPDHKKQQHKEDPWHHGSDPWAQYAASSSGSATIDKFKQLKEQLTSEMKDALRQELEDNSMNVDTAAEIDAQYQVQTEARFSTLETDIKELKAQNLTFQNWFHESAQADTRLQGQLQEMHNQVMAQQNDLEVVKHELASQTGTASQLRDELSQVRSEMTGGFGRLEALLEKRTRTA